MNEARADRPFGGSLPWGPREAFTGLGIQVGVFLLSSVVVLLLIRAVGSEPVLQNAGDIFELSGRVVEYADERLRAAARGDELPEPPTLLTDFVSLRIALATTVLFQLVTIASVMVVTRRGPGELVRLLRFDEFTSTRWGRAAGLTFLAYVGVVAWAVFANAFLPDFFVPESTVPSGVARDPGSLALAGLAAVIMAPLAEEIFYRGLLFGGFLKWGFWPAAVVSSAIFSAVHLDPGSVVPFLGVGIALCWVYWRGGRLWDAIAFHCFFNSTSFAILAATGG